MKNFILLAEYPANDEGYGSENESAWFELVKMVRREMAIAKDDDSASVIAERFDSFSVEVCISRPRNFLPSVVYAAAQRIREALRSISGYWRVKVWLEDQTEVSVWLIVDQFGVNEYLGKVHTERFEDIVSFYRHHWGTDFGVKL